MALTPTSSTSRDRDALERWIRGGGVLIISACFPDSITSAWRSWIAAHLPLQHIGHRVASGGRHRADPRDGHLQRSAAGRRGCTRGGRRRRERPKLCALRIQAAWIGAAVAMTTFPIGALDPTNDVTPRLWNRLTGSGEILVPWQSISTPRQRLEILQAMIGTPTASWRWAAIACGGYALVVAGVHGFAGKHAALRRSQSSGRRQSCRRWLSLSRRRPAARPPRQCPAAQSCSMSPKAATPSCMRPSLASAREPSPCAEKPQTILRPSITLDASTGRVELPSFTANEVRISPANVASLWDSRALLDETNRFSASIRFTESGAQLETRTICASSPDASTGLGRAVAGAGDSDRNEQLQPVRYRRS